jgi:hypothetical protein
MYAIDVAYAYMQSLVCYVYIYAYMYVIHMASGVCASVYADMYTCYLCNLTQ